MKKITFKTIAFLFVCLLSLQMQAQFAGGTYRFKTQLASPDAINGSKTPPYVDQFVYPTANVSSSQFALKMEPKDLNSNLQIFTFVAISGSMYTYNDVAYQVFNIVSEETGRGVLERANLTSTGTRMNLKGQTTVPDTRGEATFIVVETSDFANDGSYFMISTDETVTPNRRITPDTNFEFCNIGAPANGTTQLGMDRWIFEAATALSVNNFDENSISISNPVNDELTIKGITKNINEVSVYNLLGQKLISFNNFDNQDIKLNVSSLVGGTYIVKITTEGNSISKKIIKK